MWNNEELFKMLVGREFEGLSLQSQIILLIIETLVVFIPGIILCCKKKITVRRLFHVYFLVVYAGIMLSFTIFRRPLGSRVGMVNMDVNLGFGKHGVKDFWASTFSLLNILLFIPWGILVGGFYKKGFFKRIFNTTFICLLTSIFIELNQILSATGRFEINDMVTNTLGGFVGAVIISILMWIF